MPWRKWREAMRISRGWPIPPTSDNRTAFLRLPAPNQPSFGACSWLRAVTCTCCRAHDRHRFQALVLILALPLAMPGFRERLITLPFPNNTFYSTPFKEGCKGTFQKRFSGFCPLRGGGGYPPIPLRKKTFFFSHWFSVKGGGVPPNSVKEKIR